MPLALDPRLKTRLVEQLAGELNNATVFANFAISSWSLRGIANIRSLPDKGELAEQLSRFIGDDPFATFVGDELDAGFAPPRGLNPNARGEAPLTDYPGYGDLNAVAETLVEAFASLPWTYQLTIKLPNPLGAAVTRAVGNEFVLSPRHRIVSGAALQETHPLLQRRQGLVGMMMNQRPAQPWEAESAYLQVSMSGYFRTHQTEPFFRARDDILTFFGLGIALGLFSEFPSDPFQPPDTTASTFYVHRFNEGRWNEQGTLDVGDQHKHGLWRLALADDALQDAGLLRARLDRIGSVFRSDLGQNIALSARWLFESHCGHDALLQYVQAAVAIEILLGDEEADPGVGLTTLMANRCAFSIAKTPAARTTFLKMFRDIYKVRSKIVHRGKSRLDAHEMRLFRQLRLILRMVIDHEQRMLERAGAEHA